MIDKETLKASKFLCEGFGGLIDINNFLNNEKLEFSMSKDIFSRITEMNEEIYKEFEKIRKVLSQYEQAELKKSGRETFRK